MKAQLYSTFQRGGNFAKAGVRPIVTFVFNPEQAPLYYQPVPAASVRSKKRGWWQRVLAVIVLVVILAAGDWLGFGPISQTSSSETAATATSNNTTVLSDASTMQLASLSAAQSVALSLNHQ